MCFRMRLCAPLHSKPGVNSMDFRKRKKAFGSLCVCVRERKRTCTSYIITIAFVQCTYSATVCALCECILLLKEAKAGSICHQKHKNFVFLSAILTVFHVADGRCVFSFSAYISHVELSKPQFNAQNSEFEIFACMLALLGSDGLRSVCVRAEKGQMKRANHLFGE